MTRFVLGCIVGAIGGAYFLHRWLGTQPIQTQDTTDPGLWIWGGTISDGPGQWTYTTSSPLT